MPETLSALVGVDMETDVGSWTPFYEGLVHGTPRLLDVFDRHGITGTFYFTAASVRAHPQVARMVADARGRGVTPFLCFYFHPWEFYEMPQGEIHYGEGFVRPDPFIVKNCGDYALTQFDRLVGQLLERGTRFWQARDLALS